VDFSNPKEMKPNCHDHCDPETEVNVEDAEILLNSETDENTSCHIVSERKSHHSDNAKKNLITRLNRVEGQIRGIKGLIEKDTYCDDVITQISATQAALNSVAKLLLEVHMRSCVVERIQEGDHEVVDELLTTIQRLMKK
jgi:DNA-binding FrmR family transcriptional regulator